MKKETSEYETPLPDRNAIDGGYPVSELERHIGSELEVHYVDAGLPQIVYATLSSRPNGRFFYLSLDGIDMNIVYWNKAHSDGRLSAVKLIRAGEQVIYRNNEVYFEDSCAIRLDRSESFKGPVRRMTREYLNGAFG